MILHGLKREESDWEARCSWFSFKELEEDEEGLEWFPVDGHVRDYLADEVAEAAAQQYVDSSGDGIDDGQEIYVEVRKVGSDKSKFFEDEACWDVSYYSRERKENEQ